MLSSSLVIPPGAQLQVAGASQADSSSLPLLVTYTNNTGIDVATLDSGDLRIVGPNGYDRFAQFVSVDRASNGTPRAATPHGANPRPRPSAHP